MNYYPLQLNEKDIRGFDVGYRLEYAAERPMDFLIELSLLQNPAFDRLSVLPPPVIGTIDPSQFQIGVPINPKTRVRSAMRPQRSVIRRQIAKTLEEHRGYFINGVRINVNKQAGK